MVEEKPHYCPSGKLTNFHILTWSRPLTRPKAWPSAYLFGIVTAMLGGGLEDIPMQGDREPLRPKVRREPANFHRSAEFPHRPPDAGWLPWVPSALQRKPSD
jgi:hypothetical protein